MKNKFVILFAMIKAIDVRKLMDATGQSLSTCYKAMVAAEGNIDQAIEMLSLRKNVGKKNIAAYWYFYMDFRLGLN